MGRLGEWRTRCAEKIVQSERAEWRECGKRSQFRTDARVKGEIREGIWTD